MILVPNRFTTARTGRFTPGQFAVDLKTGEIVMVVAEHIAGSEAGSVEANSRSAEESVFISPYHLVTVQNAAEADAVTDQVLDDEI